MIAAQGAVGAAHARSRRDIRIRASPAASRRWALSRVPDPCYRPLVRETYLERCLQRLLDCPELNLDEVEEETRAAIEQASAVVKSPAVTDLTELEHTVVYIGEQVETFRAVLERLCDEVAAVRKQLGKADRQKSLFQEPGESACS